MSFVTGIWENFIQLAAAFGVLVGFLIGLAWMISQSKTVKTWWSEKQEKKRMETCPMRVECNIKNKEQDEQIKRMDKGFLMMQGGLIALHCTIAIQRGYLSKYDRVWLQNAFDDYQKKGGNHGVEDLFNEALALPETPIKNRRCTD